MDVCVAYLGEEVNIYMERQVCEDISVAEGKLQQRPALAVTICSSSLP